MTGHSPDELEVPDSFLDFSVAKIVRTEFIDAQAEEWIGELIDSYRLDALIGAGAHGVVFAAERTKPYRQTVAIKLFPSLRQAEGATRFEQECQTLADLGHPGIATILGAGLTEDRTPYLVMPLIDGVAIDEYVAMNSCDFQQVAGLIRQLTAAIAYAHQKQIIHCDIKPDNVLVSKDGQVTVTDLGLAVRLDKVGDLAMRPSWQPGTIGYSAPEILRSRTDMSRVADVYSIGAILHKLLTGDPPHRVSGLLGSLAAAEKGQAPPVQSLCEDVPDELARICDRCLANDREKRFESAEKLDSELAGFLDSQPSETPPREGRDRRAVIAVFVALAMTLIPAFLVERRGVQTGPSERFIAPEQVSDEEVNRQLKSIVDEHLKPGLTIPKEPGEIKTVFETLRIGVDKLEALNARAPKHKTVRYRLATCLFLLGRASLWMSDADKSEQSLARADAMFRQLDREFPDDGYMFDFFHALLAQVSASPPRKKPALLHMALGVIEALRDGPNHTNIDYADAHACVCAYLARTYLKEDYPEVFDLEKAAVFAEKAKEVAEWTCRQPSSVPLHRKHIMGANHALSEIARHQSDFEKALSFAAIALDESRRLREELQFGDTVLHEYEMTLSYGIALRNLDRSNEALAYANKADKLVAHLEELQWPQVRFVKQEVERFRESLRF